MNVTYAIVYGIVGAFGGLAAGDWAYWRVRGSNPRGSSREILGSFVCGVVVAVVASAVYVPAGLHSFVFGAAARWPGSVFLGVCLGIYRGVTYRGERLLKSKEPDTD